MWSKELFEKVESKQNSCAVYVKLKIIKTQEMLWIYNVHLKAGITNGEETRVNQMRSILKHVNTHNDKYAIIGDFNDELSPEGKLIEMIKHLECHDTPASCYARKRWYRFDKIATKSLIF